MIVICSGCGEEYERTGRSRRRCPECVRAYQRAWRASRSLATATCYGCGKPFEKKVRNYCAKCDSINKRRYAYGISEGEYQEILRRQDYRCAICTKAFILRQNTKGMQTKDDPVVDHCHSTQRVRGILCRSCNVGLGHFQDDPSLLQAAIAHINTEPMFRKFTRAESTQVVTPKGHQAIEEELHKLNKTSARDLTDDQRDSLRVSLDRSDSE